MRNLDGMHTPGRKFAQLLSARVDRALLARDAREGRDRSFDAVAELCTAQRADLASTAVLVATLSSVGSAYVAGSLFYHRELESAIHTALAFVPIPVWILATFAALSNIAMRHRMLVLRQVEDQIVRASPLRGVASIAKLWHEADDIMESNRARRGDRVTIFSATSGVIISMIAYTWWLVGLAALPTWLAASVGALYGVWAFALAFTLIRGHLRIRSAINDESSPVM